MRVFFGTSATRRDDVATGVATRTATLLAVGVVDTNAGPAGGGVFIGDSVVDMTTEVTSEPRTREAITTVEFSVLATGGTIGAGGVIGNASMTARTLGAGRTAARCDKNVGLTGGLVGGTVGGPDVDEGGKVVETGSVASGT